MFYFEKCFNEIQFINDLIVEILIKHKTIKRTPHRHVFSSSYKRTT